MACLSSRANWHCAGTPLVLKIPADGKTKHYRIQAKVANVRRHGARFIFRTLDEKAYAALVDLLYPAEP
jgi:hypothetical protein